MSLSFGSSLGRSLRVACISFAVVGSIAALGQISGLEWEALLRDPQPGDPLWHGLVSHLGVAMMLGAAVLCIRAVIRQRHHVALFAVAAAFATVFAADDFFRFHEGPREIFYVSGYTIGIVLIYVFAMKKSERLIIWPILVALSAFVASVLVDVTWQRFPEYGLPVLPRGHWSVGMFLEDGMKFVGIVTLASVLWGEALSSSRNVIRTAVRTPEDRPLRSRPHPAKSRPPAHLHPTVTPPIRAHENARP